MMVVQRATQSLTGEVLPEPQPYLAIPAVVNIANIAMAMACGVVSFSNMCLGQSVGSEAFGSHAMGNYEPWVAARNQGHRYELDSTRDSTRTVPLQ